MKPDFLRRGIRIGAFILTAFSLRYGAADAFYFLAKQPGGPAVEDVEGKKHLETAISVGGSDPRYLMKLGKSLLETAGEDGRGPEKSAEAARIFRKVTGILPDYGKGWFYLARAELQAQLQSRDGLTPQKWREIRSLFDAARKRAPGNVWMTYHYGRLLLLHAPSGDQETRREALGWLAKAAGQLPSIYLEPALRDVWIGTRETASLIRITPETYSAYLTLSRFLESERLWKTREFISHLLQRKKEALYQELMQRGREAYEKKDFQEAWNLFRDAYARDPKRPGVRLAMIAIKGQMRGSSVWDEQKVLRETLEALEEEPGESSVPFWLEQVQSRVIPMRDPYMKGLYWYHRSDRRRALKWLEHSAARGRLHRLVLARLLEQSGRKEKAAKMLLPALEEKTPDLRELLLLKKTGYEPDAVEQKIQAVSSREGRPGDWSGKDYRGPVLDRPGFMGHVLNLKPGKVQIVFALKGKPDSRGQYGFVHVRLGRHYLGSVYVDHTAWRSYRFEAVTSGGRHWLNLELVNGESPPGTSPEVLPGNWKVR